MCAAAGISPPTIEQSAAYLQNWINVLKGDKRLVVSAAGAAQKAADLMLGTSFENAAAPPKPQTGQQYDKPVSPSQPELPEPTTSSQLGLF